MKRDEKRGRPSWPREKNRWDDKQMNEMTDKVKINERSPWTQLMVLHIVEIK